MNRRTAAFLLFASCGSILSGCSAGLDTAYGRMRGASVNGTGALAALFREQGHEVRAAVRLSDELDEWADVIVRFAPYPGPPDREEAEWFSRWMNREPNRQLIYIPRDYDAEADYWSAVLAHLPGDTKPALRERAEKAREKAKNWTDRLTGRPKETADATDWFAISPASKPPHPCKTLEGPWADEIDAAAAAVSEHESLKVDAETVLLSCGEKQTALAIEWTRFNGSQVLVLANGSFLLNAALLNPARRPLASRVVEWIGDEPLHVAFAEGRALLSDRPAFPTMWGILTRVASIRWVAIQMLVLGLAACLARAPRLGRARPEPPSGADRPAAHAEALGALLQRGGHSREARSILDAYRRWRYPSRASHYPAEVGPRPTAVTLPSSHGPESEPSSGIEFLES